MRLLRTVNKRVESLTIELDGKSVIVTTEAPDGLPAAAPPRAELISLDLSLGTLNDAEARELADAAARLPRLETLNVDDTFVGKVGLRALRAAFPHDGDREGGDRAGLSRVVRPNDDSDPTF